MISQQSWGKGFAISKELTHSTSFCKVQLLKNQNMIEIFNIKLKTKHKQSDAFRSCCALKFSVKIDYQCTTDVWKRKCQVTVASSPASKMAGTMQLLLCHSKETNRIYGPASWDIYPKYISILIPSEKEVTIRESHLSSFIFYL